LLIKNEACLPAGGLQIYESIPVKNGAGFYSFMP